MSEFIYGAGAKVAISAQTTQIKDRACMVYDSIKEQTSNGSSRVRGSITDFIKAAPMPPEFFLSKRLHKKVAQTTLMNRYIQALAWLDVHQYVSGEKHGPGDWTISLINNSPPSGEQLRFELGSNMAEHKKNIKEINSKMVGLESLINEVWEDISLMKVDLSDYRKTALEVPRDEIEALKRQVSLMVNTLSELTRNVDDLSTELAQRKRKKWFGIF